MYTYAQLEFDVVIGVSQLSGKVTSENMIDITDLKEKPFIGSVYDSEKNSFTSPILVEPTPSIEEQILIENQYQTALIEMNMMGAM